MPTKEQLPSEVLKEIEREAREYAFHNYHHAGFNPDARIDDIGTWTYAATVSYYTILYYLAGNNAAHPEPGMFSVDKLVATQKEATVLRRALEIIRDAHQPANEAATKGWIDEARATANAALTAYRGKEEGSGE